MAKVTQQPSGEIIPRPVLNNPTSSGVWRASDVAAAPAPQKRKFTLLDKANEVVATLIDRALADQWVSEGKKGAIKIVEDVLALTT